MINIATGRTIRVFEGHEGAVSSVCVHEITGTHRYIFGGGNATFRGRAWYKLLDALVLTLDVTV